jgi:hypothetical protein
MDGIPALLKSLKDALNPGLEPPHTSGDAAHYLSDMEPDEDGHTLLDTCCCSACESMVFDIYF